LSSNFILPLLQLKLRFCLTFSLIPILNFVSVPSQRCRLFQNLVCAYLGHLSLRLCLKRVREARFTSPSYFVCFFLGWSVFICLSSMFYQMKLSCMCSWMLVVLFFCLACVEQWGENWYSRLGELVSPKREYQKLAQGSASSTRPARGCVLSDMPARSGETASPEREIVKSSRTHCCRLA